MGNAMRKTMLFAATAMAVGLAISGCGQQAGDWRKPAGKEWPTVGGDWGNTRYSTLNAINTANVKGLGAAWVHTFENERPTGAPVISGGRMFIATAGGQVYALNPKTGDVLWRTKPN